MGQPGDVDFGAGPATGSLDVRWIHGAPRGGDPGPAIQVHAYDEHTYLLRQSKAVSFEAPFLYLLFGNDRALLLDTGATADPLRFPLRQVVDGVVAEWLAAHPRPGYQLVVAHSHGHRDHVAGDGQFADRPDTTVVGAAAGDVQAFFGFGRWPHEVVRYDLGGRVLDVVGIPGHHPASLAMFDPWTGFLLTGDTVYPGRLYAFDMPAFVASLDRLADFAAARPVRHVMGCHIEMSRTPGRDYPLGARYQPDEPPLQMTTSQLLRVRAAAHTAASRPGVHVSDDFIVVNLEGRFVQLRLVARGLRQRLRRR